MNQPPHRPEAKSRSRHVVVTALGFTQIFGYGTTFYLLAVLALPIAHDTAWPLDWVAAGLSIGLFVGGVAAPLVGRAIDRHGGRPVLAGGSLLFAFGLVGVGLSTHVLLYWLAWVIVGLGMAAGLYDAAFSALGRWYRSEARTPITTVTLWGGFASTLCWPLSAYLVASAGWRWTCLVYAGIHLLVALPLHAFLMPRAAAEPAFSQSAGGARPSLAHQRLLFVLIACSLTLSSVIVTLISVHLIPVLQERGFSAAAAVSVGALIGPSQVAGRLTELAVGSRVHPIWSSLVAGLMMTAGLLILNVNIELAALAVIAYAMGAGVSYIVRGTLPLVMFGADGYATLIGKLAFPSLIAQALAPWAGAIVLARWSTDTLLGILLALAIGNIVAIVGVALVRRRRF